MADWIPLLIALTFCITVHECAHAWAAFKLGDPTAKMEGRVSLNPLRHLDVLGTLMIFIAHFGWGKPVPYNENNLKHPRRDAALISIAGPFTNLLTAFAIALLLKFFPQMPTFAFDTLRAIFSLSIILFLFNLIPIAPLDGSKFLGLLVPKSKLNWYHRYLSQGPIYLIILIIGDRLLSETTGFSPLGLALQYGYEAVTVVIFLAT
jgi:Zn-dependent protease